MTSKNIPALHIFAGLRPRVLYGFKSLRLSMVLGFHKGRSLNQRLANLAATTRMQPSSRAYTGELVRGGTL